MAAKKQSSGVPSTYEQQQAMRQQRQRMMQSKGSAPQTSGKGKDQMVYAEGKADAAAAQKRQSQSVDYSKARTGSYSGPSLDTLNGMLERAQASGDAARIKRVKDQIAAAKKAGAK